MNKKSLLFILGHIIFKLRGWTFEPLPDYWEKRQVIIGFPHTSMLDTFMAFAAFAIAGKKGHVIVKEEAFIWPFAGLLRALGAISVNRNIKGGVVEEMHKQFQSREEFQLSLVPEGTRKKTSKLKTGFWYIAKEANVPIVCWYLDNKNKKTIWAGRILPGENIEEDMKRIKAIYLLKGYEIDKSI